LAGFDGPRPRRVDQHRDEIRALVVARDAPGPLVFGSIAPGEDAASSDVDVT
jgi:predicted nucleotidyltransferase